MSRNFVYTGISIGSRLLTGLCLFVLLARLWGPETFGLYSFVFSLVAILVLLVDFGFSGYLLREIGATPEALVPIFRDGLFAKSVLVPVCLLIAALLVASLGAATPLALVIPLLLAALLLSFADFCIAPLRALGRYDLETKIIVSTNLAQFSAAAGVAWVGGSPIEVAWVIVASRCVYLMVAAIGLRRAVPALTQVAPARASLKTTFRRIAPYGLDGLLTTAWSQLDVVLVRALYGAHGAGLYAAGQKLVQGACALAPVVGNVMIPRLSRLAATESTQLAHVGAKTAGLLWVMGFVFSLPLLVFPELVAVFFFGAAYEQLGGYFRLFGVVLLLRFGAAGFGVLVTAAGMQSRRVIGQCVGLCVFLLAVVAAFTFNLDLDAFLFAYAAGFVTIALIYRSLWRSFLVNHKLGITAA